MLFHGGTGFKTYRILRIAGRSCMLEVRFAGIWRRATLHLAMRRAPQKTLQESLVQLPLGRRGGLPVDDVINRFVRAHISQSVQLV